MCFAGSSGFTVSSWIIGRRCSALDGGGDGLIKNSKAVGFEEFHFVFGQSEGISFFC